MLALVVISVGLAVAARAQENGCLIDLKDNPVISLNLKNADVSDIFRLIAEQNDLNIIVSPKVHGTLSLRLSSVTLVEAMQVILDASDSKIECSENIMRIYARSESAGVEQVKQEMVTEIFSINYVSSAELVAVINDVLSPDGKVKTFSPSRSDNTNISKPPMIIVTDYPLNVENVRKLIEKLDVETPQIAIEAKIVETKLDKEDMLGVDWKMKASLKGSPARIDTPYSSTGEIGYGILSLKDFSAVWERIMTNDNSNVLQNVNLSTIDNTPAEIHVGQTVPVGITTLGAGGSNGTVVGTTGIQEWNVGVTLKVTPHVLDNQIIMMSIDPEVSNIESFTQLGGTDSSSAPITNDRTVKTNIMLRSGETIVIGGLVKDSDSVENSKVPLLGDLPLVGSMFRKKRTLHAKTNLVIFITARIIDARGMPADTSKSAPPLNEFLEYK
jgi:type II secretory pathway component GspD/PulD (secretin)